MASMRDEGILEALLKDVAQRIQLPPSKHEVAERQYRALTDHIDREGSPLEGKVEVAYPSGSFAIHAAIASRVRSEQYDVDIVVELNLPRTMTPRQVLTLTFDAINGTQGSAYYGKIKQHSRCVTVTYADGVTIDIMPVVRLNEPTEKASQLFHYKREASEEYLKEVNPFGFADLFNKLVSNGALSAGAYRRRNAGGLIVEAEAQPLPAAVPFEKKPLRVLALQLLKRHRVVAYRNRNESRREPPSVMQASLALKAGPPAATLTEELLNVARAVRAEIHAAEAAGKLVEVYNPALPHRDLFTDRWPEDRRAQQLYVEDLRKLIVTINNLSARDFEPQTVKRELEGLFGEAASEYALNEHFARQERARKAGLLGVARQGRVGIVGATVATGVATAVRANTNMGGDKLEEL